MNLLRGISFRKLGHVDSGRGGLLFALVLFAGCFLGGGLLILEAFAAGRNFYPKSATRVVNAPNDARTGTLLFVAKEPGKYVAAPQVGTDFDITVSGPTARTQLTQHFLNPTGGWVEAVYVFPLPETAAVDTLKMVIGDRVVVGNIKEREEAKRTFKRAKAEGKKAALVEQQRPNLFTYRVANIGPGESIVVQLEYQ